MLQNMKSKRFRQIVVAVMAVTGAIMLWQERGVIASFMESGDFQF